jgi:molecular chaperone DnaK
MDLKDVMKGENTERINQKIDELAAASHKLAEAMYASATGAGGSGSAQAENAGGAGTSQRPNEDVVDAEFEEVKGDKK